MTLTELKYVIALAREKHFGKAAQACFVSQPTLSVSIKKLEDELGVQIFERNHNAVNVTMQGEQIVHQALNILEQVDALKDLAKKNSDPLSGDLKIGLIFTVAPYLLPEIMPQLLRRLPNVKPILQEGYTQDLLSMLRDGNLDCAIMAEPFEHKGMAIAPLYDEPYWVALPRQHKLAQQASISVEQLKHERLLLLSKGHCLREHALQACSENDVSLAVSTANSINFSGSSLTTIQYMVSAGMGVTVVPATCVPAAIRQNSQEKSTETELIHYLPLMPQQSRKIVLAWRRSFPQYKIMAELRNAIVTSPIIGVNFCSLETSSAS